MRTLCLGVLSKGDASGYEIKKQFEEGPFSHFHEAGYGSIYPALTRLTKEGLVQCTQLAQQKRPDKKVYRVTAAGRQALVEALTRPPVRDKLHSDFLFLLSFAHLLDPARIDHLIGQRHDWYRDMIARMEECGRALDRTGAEAASERFVHGFGLAVYRAAMAYLDENHASLRAALENPGLENPGLENPGPEHPSPEHPGPEHPGLEHPGPPVTA